LPAFLRGGRDKAPVPGKAEAKADRYAPFFKNVDESGARRPPSLTPIPPESRTVCGHVSENAKQYLREA